MQLLRAFPQQAVVQRWGYAKGIREAVDRYLNDHPDCEAWFIEGCIEIRMPRFATLPSYPRDFIG